MATTIKYCRSMSVPVSQAHFRREQVIIIIILWPLTENSIELQVVVEDLNALQDCVGNKKS